LNTGELKVVYRLIQGLSLVLACAWLIAVSATASFGDDAEDSEVESPLRFIAPKTYDMKIGLRLTTGNGAMAGTTATTVFPTEWPEQKVEIIAPPSASSFATDFRNLPGGNRQLLMFARSFPAHSSQEVTATVRITKSHTVGPNDPTGLVIPRRVSRDLRQFLADSPYIKATGSDVRRIVREIDKEEFDTDWERIEAYYDWVRENIEYVFDGYDWDTLEGWKNAGEKSTWQLTVSQPGDYQVSLRYGCRPLDAGGTIRISSSDASIEHKVEATTTADQFQDFNGKIPMQSKQFAFLTAIKKRTAIKARQPTSNGPISK